MFRKRNGIFENGKVVYIKLEDILPNPNQPRKFFEQESLGELADSIRRYGVLQPLSVRRKGEYYELVAASGG